jgi:hypothetical protein
MSKALTGNLLNCGTPSALRLADSLCAVCSIAYHQPIEPSPDLILARECLEGVMELLKDK